MIQLSVASCPSPEYTTGVSTVISGGSVERKPHRAIKYHEKKEKRENFVVVVVVFEMSQINTKTFHTERK